MTTQSRRTLRPIPADARIERQYRDAVNRVYFLPIVQRLQTALRGASSLADVNRIIARARRRGFLNVEPSLFLNAPDDDLQGVIRALISVLNRQHSREFARSFFAVAGWRAALDSPLAQTYMEGWRRENIQLIRTIPNRFLDAVERDVGRLFETKPFDQQALAKVLSEKYESSGYNLRRITRDQTAKASGNFNQIRQRQAGVKSYIWRTVQDEAVRDEHRALDGQTFDWIDPPAIGNPPAGVQCRCTAEAIINVRELRAARQGRVGGQRASGTRAARRARQRTTRRVARRRVG